MKFSSRRLYWMTSLLALVAAGAALLHPIPVVAQERVYLNQPAIQANLIGKSIAAPDAPVAAQVRFD